MKKFRKLLSIILVGALSLTLLAGCGKEETPTTEDDKTGEPKVEVSEEKRDPDEVIPLKWYLPVDPQADLESVQDAVNEYVKDTYGMNLDLTMVMSGFGDNDQVMQMVISSGEEYDIAWTSSWNNNFYENINKNAFIELDELLDEYAPELKDSMSDEIWGAVTVKGNIYGVPNQQAFAKHNFISIVKEYADEYDLDIDSVNGLEDLDEFFNEIKADNPDLYPFAIGSKGMLNILAAAHNFEPLIGQSIPGAIRLGDESLEVINQFKMDETLDNYKLMNKWSNEGIIQKDAATVESGGLAGMQTGKHIATADATFKPGVELLVEDKFGGKEMEYAMISEPWISTDGVVATINSISRTSKRPEEAMEFLNYVNTDPELYSMLCFGIEGEHYTRNDDDTITLIDGSGYNPNGDWVFGNQFNAYIKEGQDEDLWEETKEINIEANKSPAMGFSFDTTVVSTEMAAVSSVVDEYQITLETGAGDMDKIYPEFIDKMERAGSEKILEELQRQINEWQEEAK